MRAERLIRYLPARHDYLTGLLDPWWRPLGERVPRPSWWPTERAWMATRSFHPERGARWLVPLPLDAVMFHVDIVGMKAIMDRYSHGAGDAVLVEAGRRIKTATTPWPVYRYDGDEFLVIARLAEQRSIDAMRTRIRDAVRPPMAISASIPAVDLVVDVRVCFARAKPDGDMARLRLDLDTAALERIGEDPGEM